MNRRALVCVALCLALAGTISITDGAAQPAGAAASEQPIPIIMGGYSPAATSFSQALRQIGDRMTARFGDRVEVSYVYNVMDVGYTTTDIFRLVDEGVLTLAYHTSSYLAERAPELGIADLPFMFADTAAARDAMDGRLGEMMTRAIEANTSYRVLGYFENGFRHISNSVRPIHSPADLRGISVRVLPSRVLERTFALFGANPEMIALTAALERIRQGAIDAQENPLSNTVTYGIHEFHRFHTLTNHLYLSRPLFIGRAAFDAWPTDIQAELRAAVREAVIAQRAARTAEEIEAARVIRSSGGQIVELSAAELQPFRDAVAPLYEEVRRRYSPELLDIAGL